MAVLGCGCVFRIWGVVIVLCWFLMDYLGLFGCGLRCFVWCLAGGDWFITCYGVAACLLIVFGLLRCWFVLCLLCLGL